jgi:FtsH-binding integral membrane protein
MSYGLQYDIAARAPASERAAFIRRTYGHLAGAILAFALIETVLIKFVNVEPIVSVMFASRLGWLLVLGAFMAVGWLAQIWAQSEASPGLQYLGLSLYVVAEAVIFLPLLYIASQVYPDAIPVAGILTLAVFGGLTLAVFVTRADFSYLGPILCIGGFIALGLIVASALIGFSLGLIFMFAMVALLCGYVLFYTSNVMLHYRTTQHVAASLALFACIATLFWYILMIVMSNRR